MTQQGPIDRPSLERWVDELAVPAVIVRSDGLVEAANAAFQSLTGPERLVANDLSAWIHPQDLDDFCRALVTARETGIPIRSTARLARPTGAIHHAFVCAPLAEVGLDGSPALLVVVENETRSADSMAADISFRALFFQNPDPRWIYDVETLAFLEVNDAAVARYGWSRDEFLAMTVLDIRDKSEGSAVQDAITLSRTTSMNTSGPWRHRLKDGTVVEIEATGHPVRFLGRDARAVLIKDLTQVLDLDRALQRERERASEILNSVSDGVYALDREFRLTFANRACEAILPGPIADLIGMSVWDIFPGARETPFYDVLTASMVTSEPGYIEDAYPPLDRYFEVDVLPQENGLAIYFRDVTEKWRADTLLRDRQRQLEARSIELEAKNVALARATAKADRMFNYSHDAICLLDASGAFVEVNPKALEIWGYAANELIGRPFADLVHPDDLPRSLAEHEAARARGSCPDFENRNVRKDGTVVPMLWSSVWSEEDQAFFATGRDMTDRHETEARLRQAQRLESVGQLTGGVAHDFNNLLTIIMGSSEELADTVGTDPTAHLLTQTVRTAAERGADLTARLLAFARRQALEPRVVDVGALLIEIDPLLRRALGAGIALDIKRDDGLWPAMIDPGQLQDAVLNLCLNAKDAMPDGGRITLRTANVHLDEAFEDASDGSEGAARYVMVCVNDTGRGMSAEVANRAFEPFFTTKASGTNSGLGLSMVYGFVKQSIGHVRITSEVGAGTTIRLFLPQAAGVPEASRTVDGRRDLGGSETILVVEDDDMVRAYVEGQLGHLGYHVLSDASGATALARIDALPHIDLLFTDVVMPGGLNGRQLADAMQLHRPGLKVLFTSGYAADAIVHHGRLDPGVQLLSKPYRRQSLAEKVRAVLDAADEPS